MKRRKRTTTGGDGSDREIGRLFASARVEPTPEERRRLMEAAAPILREHAREAVRAAGAAPAAPRASRFDRRRAFALAFAAAAVAAIVVTTRPPATRETRSAPVLTWAEHERPDPAHPFPLVSASFGRAY
jgi:hypothetical protein